MLVLVRCFSYTPHAGFSEVFLLHSWPVLILVRCFSYLMLVLVRCFSHTPHASFSEVFLLLTTPSPKQPFSFLGRLAINSYLALCQQESDSVACGSAWLTVHSGG